MDYLLSGFVDYFLPFVVILSVLVFVHEFGHYWVARRFNVKIEVFSIGFGREIFGWTDRVNTRWKFCLIPFGGYVKMFGDEDPASSQRSKKKFTATQKKVAFLFKPLGQKALIVLAGPAFNYLFAIVLLAVLFATSGQPYTSSTISAIQPESPAAAAGLLPGDRVVSIDGSTVYRFEDIQRTTRLSPGENLEFGVERGGKVLLIPVVPKAVEQKDPLGNARIIGLIGITSAEIVRVQHTPVVALWEAIRESYNLTRATFKALGQIVSGTRSSDEIGGPLRIAKMSGDVAQSGWATIIFFTALLSINLGMINLFPIPVLDGGHLLFYAIEVIIGRPPSEKLQNYGAAVGLTLVVMLMLFATWNDLSQLKVIDYLKSLAG